MKLKGDKINIGVCTEEKDLGVTFDTDLTFDKHINNIITKAKQTLGINRRTFSYLDKDTFVKLYKSLVRPHLEYANTVWYPYLKRQSIALEKVQRRATKILAECSEMSYKNRLSFLGLHSLKGRRIRGDIIETYKIFNGFTDVKPESLFQMSHNLHTRNADCKIFTEHTNTSKRKYSFGYRVAGLWNELPKHIKFAKNVNSFKTLLDNHPKFKVLFYDHDG